MRVSVYRLIASKRSNEPSGVLMNNDTASSCILVTVGRKLSYTLLT